MMLALSIALAVVAVVAVRAVSILPCFRSKRYPVRTRRRDETCSVGIFLGSG